MGGIIDDGCRDGVGVIDGAHVGGIEKFACSIDGCADGMMECNGGMGIIDGMRGIDDIPCTVICIGTACT